MPLTVEVKDERVLTVPVPCSAIDTEQAGKFLVNAGQDGYELKEVTLIQEDKGSQRDPWLVTKGVKFRVVKATP